MIRKGQARSGKTASGTTVASIGYGYNPDGLLTSETTSGLAGPASSTYTYDEAAGWPRGTTAPPRRPTPTGGALALTDIHRNQAGQFTPAGTALAGSKAYDPWGSLTATSGFMTGMLGYQSAWADPASGKNLMGARWYNPGAGDFTSADTVQVSPDPDPAAGDPFAYAADNPLTGIDPTGHQVEPSGIGAVTPAIAKINAAIGAAVLANERKFAAAQAAAQAAARPPPPRPPPPRPPQRRSPPTAPGTTWRPWAPACRPCTARPAAR